MMLQHRLGFITQKGLETDTGSRRFSTTIWNMMCAVVAKWFISNAIQSKIGVEKSKQQNQFADVFLENPLEKTIRRTWFSISKGSKV